MQSFLHRFQISPDHGFLPSEDPKHGLPTNREWFDLADDLPKLLSQDNFRRVVEDMPPFQSGLTQNPEEVEAEMKALSYVGHAYLWGVREVTSRLPGNLSRAWVDVAARTGRPPILSYPSYCLYNWKRKDPSKPPFLGNIRITQNFLGGIDEDWFILIHVDIEARAARAIRAIPGILEGLEKKDSDTIGQGLKEVVRSLKEINSTMLRMPENCDPYIYYTRVRPYIFGTKNNPALPEGLVYSGCFNDKPRFFRGETGAQSSIVPSLDALLEVRHKKDPLKEYLMEMRDYMPLPHRRFIEYVEENSSLRSFVNKQKSEGELRDLYNECVDELFKFRAKHLEYASSYIHKQSLQPNNSVEVGTGGTPFMKYLAKHRDETLLNIYG